MDSMGLFLILLLAAAGTCYGQATAPSQETPVFRTGVSYVRVDVQVTEGDRLITGLTAADFQVWDNGAPQQISYFGQEAEPVALLLLLDVSGSMRSYLEQMAATARRALKALKPGDRVGVMLFSRLRRMALEFTDNHGEVEAQLAAAVREEDLGATTLMNAAVMEAADVLHHEEEKRIERHAVLVVTDNISLGYKTPDEAAIKALYRADAVLNAIVVGKGHRPAPPAPGRTANPDFAPEDIFRIAEETGGEAVKVNRADGIFPQMMERARTRYSMSFRAPEAKAGAFRRLRVDLSPAARKLYPNARLRYRAGYYAG